MAMRQPLSSLRKFKEPPKIPAMPAIRPVETSTGRRKPDQDAADRGQYGGEVGHNLLLLWERWNHSRPLVCAMIGMSNATLIHRNAGQARYWIYRASKPQSKIDDQWPQQTTDLSTLLQPSRSGPDVMKAFAGIAKAATVLEGLDARPGTDHSALRSPPDATTASPSTPRRRNRATRKKSARRWNGDLQGAGHRSCTRARTGSVHAPEAGT
jgi:hypothetical protein